MSSNHKPFVQERTSHRPERYAERVKEELVDLVPGNLRDPRLFGVKFLTITMVDCSPDLKNANVMFSLMGQTEDARSAEIEGALNDAAGYLRRELMKRLKTKITPHLHFKFDKGLDHAAELSPLYRKLATERAEVGPVTDFPEPMEKKTSKKAK